ncbi:Abhydrolase domain-containing protein 11 [Dirofilaria immitis]|nr:Abhydrolase domain-containing protein 11 [Dirofilaria immitis]
MTYAEMANDVQYFIDEIVRQEIGEFSKVHLLGHSMGGKVAMRIALMKGSDLRRYSSKRIQFFDIFSKIIEVMKSIDLTCNRAEIERELAAVIADRITRLFLLTNLSRANQDMYNWRINLNSIEYHIRELCGSPGIENEGVYAGSVSKYVVPSDHPLILKHFPNTQFSVIPNAGHWVHAENPVNL